MDFEVATEQAAAFGGETLRDAVPQAADGGDGGDTEGEASENDTQAANAGAKLAAGEAERGGQETSSETRPSTMRTMRSQRAARAGS